MKKDLLYKLKQTWQNFDIQIFANIYGRVHRVQEAKIDEFLQMILMLSIDLLIYVIIRLPYRCCRLPMQQSQDI